MDGWRRLAHALDPATTEARDLLQLPVDRRPLELWERRNPQLGVDAPREARANPRHRRQDLLGLRGALQFLQQAVAPGLHHIGDRTCEPCANIRQCDEPRTAVGLQERGDGLVKGMERRGCLAVGAPPRR